MVLVCVVHACFQETTSSGSGIKGFFSSVFQRKKSSKTQRSAHAQEAAQPTKTEDAAKPRKVASFMDLVALQSCEGSWEMTERLAEVLGNTVAHLKAKQTEQVCDFILLNIRSF